MFCCVCLLCFVVGLKESQNEGGIMDLFLRNGIRKKHKGSVVASAQVTGRCHQFQLLKSYSGSCFFPEALQNLDRTERRKLSGLFIFSFWAVHDMSLFL